MMQKTFGKLRTLFAIVLVTTAGTTAAQQSAAKAKLADGVTLPPDANGDVALEGQPWLQPMADRVMARGQKSEAWEMGLGLELEGMDAAWLATGNGADLAYVKKQIDALISDDGTLKGDVDGHFATATLAGRQLLLLYRVYGTAKYLKAAQKIHDGVVGSSGDNDVEMLSAPFESEYASVFHETNEFAAIANASAKAQRKEWDSRNPMFGSTIAKQMLSLVDAIPYFPSDSPERAKMIVALNRLADLAVQKQDAKTGGWTISRDSEMSSALFSYALLKGVRLGQMPAALQKNGIRGFAAVQEKFDPSDTDPAEIGAYMLAASEMEMASEALLGRGKTVMVDAWFNSQKQKDATGAMVYYHYKWDDMANSGFSLLGHLFRERGMATDTLYSAPSVKNLGKATIYIIASPDIPIKNPNPNYMTAAESDAIAAWVKAGGVLVMMENDGNNSEFTHFNLLADKFGLHFNPVDRNTVTGKPPVEEMGELDIPADSVFAHPHVAFMKEICTLTLSGNAKAVYSDLGDVLIATAKFGKGTVIALPDPWVYNEYTDGRNLPPPFNNYAAADDLVRWLLLQTTNIKLPATGGQKQEKQKP